MSNFNMMRMKAYLQHIGLGVASICVGISIMIGIVAEIFQAYDAGSTNAYVWGIIVCVLIILTGIVLIIKGALSKHSIFKGWSQEEVRQFYNELREDTTLVFGDNLIITRHFVVTYTRIWLSTVYMIKMKDLVACFGQGSVNSAGSLISYRLSIFDKSFKKIEFVVKGPKSRIMDEGYKALLSLSPWVFSEDYDDFVGSYRRKSKEKAYLKELEFRRGESDDHFDETMPLQMVTAADIIKRFNEKQKRLSKTNDIKEGARLIFQKKKEDDEDND